MYDQKDRVEKMEIKRENEKKIVERIASKQKMNKHSALLVKRKCVSFLIQMCFGFHVLLYNLIIIIFNLGTRGSRVVR